MTQPLALLLYERLLPGSQILHKLQDQGYRVATVPGPEALVEVCRRDRPILLIADVADRSDAVCAALTLLRSTGETSHIPVIAVFPTGLTAIEEAARRTGAKLVVQDNVILNHLDQFLDQALALE